MTRSFESVLTLAILLVAVCWAGRKLWRWVRRGSRTEAVDRGDGCAVTGCGTAAGPATDCGHCLVVTPLLERRADDPPGDHGRKD